MQMKKRRTLLYTLVRYRDRKVERVRYTDRNIKRVRYRDRDKKIERVEEEMADNYSDEEEDDIIHIGEI